MAKKKPAPPPSPSYVVLAAARQLIERETCTLKQLAERVDMPPTSLAAMLAPGYENMTLTRLDALKQAVKDIRADAAKS